jgi:chemotaxis protein methyltransferase CheR
VSLAITASDVDETMLARAREGCFAAASLRELPASLVALGFKRVGSSYCVRSRYQEGIEFLKQDLRSDMPPHLFDVILCRYVAFTYFALPLQRRVLARIIERLRPDGFLVIGAHEDLPADVPGLTPLTGQPRIFQKRMEMSSGDFPLLN